MAITRRTVLTTCFALAAIVVAAGVYVFSVALSEDISFQEYGPAYWIVVTSDTVREFPRFEADGETATFTYRARDGTAPGQITLVYRSDRPADSLVSEMRAHCSKAGFARVGQDDLFLSGRFGCDAPDYRIEVDLEPRDDTVAVTVRFLETEPSSAP